MNKRPCRGNTCYLCLNDSMVCVGNSIKNIQLVHRIATAGNNFSSIYVNHMICQLNIEGNMYLEKCYDFDISVFPWNPFGDPSFTSVFILNRVTLKQGSILWVHILSPTSDFHTPGTHFKRFLLWGFFLPSPSPKALVLALSLGRFCWKSVMCLPIFRFQNSTRFSFLLFVNASHTIHIFWSHYFPFPNSTKILCISLPSSLSEKKNPENQNNQELVKQTNKQNIGHPISRIN